MNRAPATENKMATPGEDKRLRLAEYTAHRCPTGELDYRVGVRLDTSGAAPVLVIEPLRRSPAEVGEDAFQPAGPGVHLQAQFAGVLVEQIRHAVLAADEAA
jgi:hypothetical protein